MMILYFSLLQLLTHNKLQVKHQGFNKHPYSFITVIKSNNFAQLFDSVKIS